MAQKQGSEVVARLPPFAVARIAAAISLAFLVPVAIADQWVGLNGGDWFVPGNWQADAVPTSTNVSINNDTTTVISSSPPTAQGGTDLRVGNTGSGGLHILGGGSLTNFNGRIGFGSGSSGTVTVSGAGSLWTNTATLTSGSSGSGVLTITNGGVVTSNATTAIGLEATGVGSIVLDGMGSTLNVGNNLYVGSSGNGTLSLQNGARLAYAPGNPDRAIHLGRFVGASGVLTVDGAESHLTASGGHLYIGDGGSGTLTVQNGGSITHTRGDLQNRTVSVGNLPGASGTLTVTGAGSSLITTENLLVGASGTGTLDILNGGMVTSDGFGIIGNVAGAVGTVTVDGAASTLLSGGSLLFVSDQGHGSLTISNGGMVRVDGGAGTALLTTAASGIGVLNIGAGASAGVLDASIVNGGNGSAILNFNHTDSDYYFTQDGTASGAPIAITGSTALNHNGSGTTALTGVNTHDGGARVNAGHLIIDGSLAGNTLVNSGGTIGGNGTLSNLTISSGGTLAPGNSPGILTVTGDLTLHAGSLTVMEIDGYIAGTQHDQVNVNGTATLNGNLQLNFGFVPMNGDRFNLINAGSFTLAGDPLTGFADISHNLGAAIQATSLIDPVSFNIVLQIHQGSFVTAAGDGLTLNQLQVAADLDRVATAGQATGLLTSLNSLPASQLPDAFDQISGVQHTHAALLYPRISRQLHDMLAQRLSGSQSNRRAGANARLDGIQVAAASNGLPSGLIGPVPVDDHRIWAQVMSGFGDIDTDRNAIAADYRSGGLALGAEAEVSERLTLGGALAYTRSNADMRRGKIKIDSYQAALYGNWQRTDSYIRGSAGFGYHDTSASRRLSFGGIEHKARTNYGGWTVALSVEAGNAIELSNAITATPFIGVDYVHAYRSNFTEKAAGDTRLRASSARSDSLQSVTGVRVQGELSGRRDQRISPYLEAAWLHEFVDRTSGLHAGFVAAPASNFRALGPKTKRDRLRVGIGVNALITKTLDLDLAYRGTLAHSDRSHLFAATLKMLW